MKKIYLVILTVSLSLFIFACSSETTTSSTSLYQPIVINAETGKSMMDHDSEIILVDVRTLSEYQTNHIPGAILLPVGDIQSNASTVLSDKTKIYIIYCNSGNRSADASSQLSEMGYPFIYDMGGIIDWPYETVSGN